MRQNNKTAKQTDRFRSMVVAITAMLFVILFVISSHCGSADIAILDLIRQCITGDRQKNFQSVFYIFTQVRLPRIVLCALTGMALGLSGCIMQNLLRNPLASPFTLGVSSGASFGAALAMVIGPIMLQKNLWSSGYSLVACNAFWFGCVSLGIVCLVSKLCKNSVSILILTGSAISSLFSAGVSILKYISSSEALKNLDIWLMGGFWAANWSAVLTILPFMVACFFFTMKFAWDFNAMNAGEDIAATLGVNVKRLKNISLILVTLVASISIAFSGVIGFIGLIAPHIARSLVGVDNRKLIPESALIGALILLLSDTVARTVLLPKEIPVGIITSLIGVPFFIFILTGKKKKIWSA
ncbi:MAG: iron ABC transporter permease [Lachnospiraceae bacterium]|nr:iron ABC transporter permease [Robinsoniella sp.]MDY3767948.1 iron ABC transporter permease [Lachnospiraceae bacterium]